MVREHIAFHGIGPGQVIFPVRLWRRVWNTAVDDAGLPFPCTPYQVRHTDASWLIDQGVDLARVQYRLGHGDLQATTRYVKMLDEDDPKAAEVMLAILGDVA